MQKYNRSNSKQITSGLNMSGRIYNGYLLASYIELITDAELVPYVMIAPSNTDREISVPMEYVVDGLLTVNVSTTATGYLSIDKETAYLSFSSRFNRISHELFIPIECIVGVRSRCGKIQLEMPPGLVILGGEIPSQPKVVPADQPVHGVQGSQGRPELQLVHSNPEVAKSPPQGNLQAVPPSTTKH